MFPWIPSKKQTTDAFHRKLIGDKLNNKMEYLFSYGTLQLKNVQLKNFGRILNGTPDKIQGYKLCSIEIQDERILSISSQKIHPILTRTAKLNDEVSGVVFELKPDELKKADSYEVKAYKRIQIKLKSGKESWVYVAN